MSTAAKLDRTYASGIKGIKESMKQTSNTIKEMNEKSTRMEEETQNAKTRFVKAYARQQAMKERSIEIEEKLMKNDEKQKELKRRVEEKERFLEESKKFNKALKVTTPDEGAVEETQEHLKTQKEIYSRNYERYQKARNLKIELEQQFEQIEIKAQDGNRRLMALRTELEYNVLEESRREHGCKDAIDHAFQAEKKVLEIQRGLDGAWKRREIANKQVIELEKKISKVEDALETTNFERRRMEATIKELLKNIRDQNRTQ